MFQQQRLDKIMEILQKNKCVKAEFLSEELHFSPSSIRRDLVFLEKQGLIKRSYGRVEIKKQGSAPFSYRKEIMKKEKQAIASVATKLIKSGETAFLGKSTTVEYMADYLVENKEKIKVITGNLPLAVFLSDSGISAFNLCGEIKQKPGIVEGVMTDESLELFSIDIGFFSCDALTEDGHLLYEEESSIANVSAILRNCKKTAVLCTSNKFGLKSFYTGATIGDVDFFISDKKLSEKLINKYKNTRFISIEE